MRGSVRPGGYVIIATFAADGPTQCSGLPAVRYSADDLHRELGPDFHLIESQGENHVTPAGVHQSFGYYLFKFASG